MWIPGMVCTGEIKFTSVWVDVGVVDGCLECDDWKCVDVIVSVWELHCEFEYGVGVESSSEEYDAVE